MKKVYAQGIHLLAFVPWESVWQIYAHLLRVKVHLYYNVSNGKFQPYHRIKNKLTTSNFNQTFFAVKLKLIGEFVMKEKV